MQRRVDTGGPVVVCTTCKGSGQYSARRELSFAQGALTVVACGKCRQACCLCTAQADAEDETVKVRIPAELILARACVFPQRRSGRMGAPPGPLHLPKSGAQVLYAQGRISRPVPVTVRRPRSPRSKSARRSKAQLRIPPGTQSGQNFAARARAPASQRAGTRDQFIDEDHLAKGNFKRQRTAAPSRNQPENPRVAMGLA